MLLFFTICILLIFYNNLFTVTVNENCLYYVDDRFEDDDEKIRVII